MQKAMTWLFAAAILAVAGCTTTGKSYLPVDSPLHTWDPPPQAAAAIKATGPNLTPSGAVEKSDSKGKK